MSVDPEPNRVPPERERVNPSVARADGAGTSRATLQALFVTFLWSTSWVLIKIGLADIPAITFAGLRYALAFLVLTPLLARPRLRAEMRSLRAVQWAQLAGLGLLMYTLTQGAQFLGLVYLPATTASLLLSFSPVAVALLGAVTLGELPSRWQWLGTAVYLTGAWVYLQPAALSGTAWLGFAIVSVGVAANAGSAVAGRGLQRSATLSPLLMTLVSMGVGSVILLGAGLAVEGLPSLGVRSWAIVAWLAIVNTAFAFTLWNATLRVLPALTSSLINNTMLVQIAALAWIFLGESLGARERAGLALAVAGVLVSQLPGARARRMD